VCLSRARGSWPSTKVRVIMARKEDAEKDKQAKIVLSQLNTKTIRRPLTSTGLAGDQLPATIMTFEDYDKVINAIDASINNVEALNVLALVGKMTGFTASGQPLRSTLKTLTINGVNNATSYASFGPGVWQVEDIVVLYSGGSGTINFRLYVYDETDGNPALEVVYGAGTSTSLFNFNNDGQFDEFANKKFGESINKGDRKLGFKPSGTFTADSMTAYVICHRVA